MLSPTSKGLAFGASASSATAIASAQSQRAGYDWTKRYPWIVEAALEALNRHRGKGQQKVTVEHVHVHAGGQAVVGVVATPAGQGPGGGDQAKIRGTTPCKADCPCT